jgi:hypothetical protein
LKKVQRSEYHSKSHLKNQEESIWDLRVEVAFDENRRAIGDRIRLLIGDEI